MESLSTLSVALGAAWTSGINLYATVLVLGLLQRFEVADLPGGLAVLENPWIIGVACVLYAVEFVADKVPYVDSIWDVVHTFIRVPAGAVVAYAAAYEMDQAVAVGAFLVGGGFALGSHGTKASVRVLANASPEPFSNWALSLVEDVIAVVGVVFAVIAPFLLAVVLSAFVILAAWLGPRLVRSIGKLLKGFGALITGKGWKTAAKVAE